LKQGFIYFVEQMHILILSGITVINSLLCFYDVTIFCSSFCVQNSVLDWKDLRQVILSLTKVSWI